MEETTEVVAQREGREGKLPQNGLPQNGSRNGGIEEMLDGGIKRKQENCKIISN